MQRKTFLMFIIAFLLVVSIGLILYFFYEKENKIIFYATIKEINDYNYIVNPLPNEKVNYSEISLVVEKKENYQIGDVIIITAKKNVAETYPVTMYAISSKLFKKGLTEITTLPVQNIITEPNQNIEIPNSPTDEGIVNDNKLETEENLITELSTYKTNINNFKNDESFKTQAKDYFITIVDFIFYEKEISGYKFNNLTNSAKLKVIKIALELDGAINTKFPNYKNDFSSNYKNIKSKLITFYLEKANEFCQNNDAVCEEAKSGFQVLKKSLNITWSFITSVGEVGAKELQNWYEIFSGK